MSKPSGKASLARAGTKTKVVGAKTAVKPATKSVSKLATKPVAKSETLKGASSMTKRVAASRAPLREQSEIKPATNFAPAPTAPTQMTAAEAAAEAALLAPKTPMRSGRGYRPGAVEATKTLAELSNQPIEFKVGDNAVYPGHGVGRVNAIETKEIAGTKLTFYSIQILDSGMKIMVPQANVKSVGLRPIISREEAYSVIGILKETNVKIDNQTWNRRYREYMEKIKTGGVREIAEVLRDLFLLKVDKELSFGERKMLDTARSLLIKELILATGRDELMKEADVKAILDLTES